MQTERVTILMTPDGKARVASRAAALGTSMGEYLRRKVEDDDDDDLTPEQEAELAELVKQANIAIPEMLATFDQMSEMLRRTSAAIHKTLRGSRAAQVSGLGEALTALKNIALLHERVAKLPSDFIAMNDNAFGLRDYVVSVDTRLSRLEGFIEGARAASGSQARLLKD